MYPAAFHEPPAECQPLCRIVVAADNKGLQSPTRQIDQKLVKQFHRLCRRHRFVIDIPGQYHSIRLFFNDPLQDLLQYVFLVFHHGKLVDPLAKMQVR